VTDPTEQKPFWESDEPKQERKEVWRGSVDGTTMILYRKVSTKGDPYLNLTYIRGRGGNQTPLNLTLFENQAILLVSGLHKGLRAFSGRDEPVSSAVLDEAQVAYDTHQKRMSGIEE